MSNVPEHRAETPNAVISDPAARKAIYGVAVAIGAVLVVFGVITQDVLDSWLAIVGQVLTVLATVLALINVSQEEVNMDFDSVEGYDVPQDPMDLLQCDSCQ